MQRVADFIASYLAQRGVSHCFMVTGGGAMHLNDAFGRHPELSVICNHHEQASAMAAEAYYRVSNRLAAVCVTTGPGGTNAITGVFGAYTDSIAMIVISGQVKWETTVASTGLPLRQFGDQEIDIIPLVQSITKYAVTVTDPATIRAHLDRALHLATEGRPGPVWLDIPMNVQGALVDPDQLAGCAPAVDAPSSWGGADLDEVVTRLSAAERPVLVVGSGVWRADAEPELLAVVETLRIPTVTTFNGHDLLSQSHPFWIGRQGTVGDRAGNFAVQNADLLLIVGARMGIRQVGYNWPSFSRGSHRIMVDVDPAELRKPSLRVDTPIVADARAFLTALLGRASEVSPGRYAEYLQWCQVRRDRYPIVLPEYFAKRSPINPYCFVDVLSDLLPTSAVVACGDGTACVATFQAGRFVRGQRVFTNSGSAPMGYDLPAAIGACLSRGGAPTVCLAGDGSLMMNLQELATIARHNLPIAIFLLDNDGYHSIRQTQRAYFPDALIGFDHATGVGFPDFERLCEAFSIPYVKTESLSSLADAIRQTLGAAGPAFCHVVLDPEQPFAPKPASRRLPDGRMVSAPLEDLAPFLSREELLGNLLIEPWEG